MLNVKAEVLAVMEKYDFFLSHNLIRTDIVTESGKHQVCPILALYYDKTGKLGSSWYHALKELVGTSEGVKVWDEGSAIVQAADAIKGVKNSNWDYELRAEMLKRTKA